MPPAWIAPGCDEGTWFVAGHTDTGPQEHRLKGHAVLLQRDRCSGDWIDLRPRLDRALSLCNPIAIAASDRRLAVVDAADSEVRLGDAAKPETQKQITFETPVVCVLRTPDNQNVVSSVEIPAAGQPGTAVKATIPFAVIPGGENYFLFMLKGFQPIWDKLQVDEKRIWKPTSA